MDCCRKKHIFPQPYHVTARTPSRPSSSGVSFYIVCTLNTLRGGPFLSIVLLSYCTSYNICIPARASIHVRIDNRSIHPGICQRGRYRTRRARGKGSTIFRNPVQREYFFTCMTPCISREVLFADNSIRFADAGCPASSESVYCSSSHAERLYSVHGNVPHIGGRSWA